MWVVACILIADLIATIAVLAGFLLGCLPTAMIVGVFLVVIIELFLTD